MPRHPATGSTPSCTDRIISVQREPSPAATGTYGSRQGVVRIGGFRQGNITLIGIHNKEGGILEILEIRTEPLHIVEFFYIHHLMRTVNHLH